MIERLFRTASTVAPKSEPGITRRHFRSPTGTAVPALIETMGGRYLTKAVYFAQQMRAAYNQGMARGWESKSVEAQMEESRDSKLAARKTPLTPEQVQQQRKKADLTLSRNRVAQQLASSSNEKYSELLRRTLAELDAQIAAL